MIKMIDDSHFEPKYLQLKDILTEKIQQGEFSVGDKFYTEKELEKTYSLSSATVARTMREMVAEGFLRRKKGSGTYVNAVATVLPNRQNAKLPLLLLNFVPFKEHFLRQPLNWFIRNNIQRGVINSWDGPVKLIEESEIFEMAGEGTDTAVINIAPGHEMLEKIKALKRPYIMIDNRRLFREEVNTVTTEHMGGVYELMKYLIEELGHRKIGFIGGCDRYHADRFAAYQIALRSYGIEFDENFVVMLAEHTREAGNHAMKKLIGAGKGMTAVFVDTDIKASGVLDAAQDEGLSVPGDISVAGFDDIPDAYKFNPPLTTVKVPYYECGQKAVEMLLRRIENGNDVESSILNTKLIIRDSCASIKS